MTESIFFDGPGFVRWLREEGADLREGVWLNSSNVRRLERCEHGDPIDIYAADLILTRVDLHLSLMPDQLPGDCADRAA